MRRREFLGALGGAAAWPLAVRAQQPTLPIIGYFNSQSPDTYADRLRAFQRGLKDAGYVEGENVAIVYRWAENQIDRLPTMAADLVRRQVAVIVANGPAALAAKAATATIPIVFFGGYDPVTVELVASLNRPGGNVTGVSLLNVELGPKRLELLRELVPSATEMALLVNPTNPNAASVTRDMQAAATSLKLTLHLLHASTEREVDHAFESASRLRAGALVIGSDPFFNTRSEQFGALTQRHRVPTIYHYRDFTAAGGLMSYGGDNSDLYSQVGRYTGRILKGEQPADLPVQQSTKVELYVNLKTAKALGLTVPPSLLARADEVIE